jgi:hypothetical protein
MQNIITPRPAVTVDPWGRVEYENQPPEEPMWKDDPGVTGFVEKVHQWQALVSDIRFRIHGRCVGPNWHIWLATRFRYLVEEQDVATAIKKLSHSSIAVLGYGSRKVFHETMLLDNCVDVVGYPVQLLIDEGDSYWEEHIGRTIVAFDYEDDPETGEKKLFMDTAGPHHGKKQETVELFVDVTPFHNKDQIESAVLSLRTHTQKFWESHACWFGDNPDEYHSNTGSAFRFGED